MNWKSSRPGAGAIGLAASGVLLGAGGVLHPRVDASLDHEQGLAGMFEAAAWTSSHLLAMAGFALLATSLALLGRAPGVGLAPRVRLLVRAAAGAAVLAALESVPHLAAQSEAAALRSGGATPLTDLHTALQIASTPAVGLTVAALAVAGARGRGLDGGRLAVALAVIGGLAFAAAGPVMALTHDSAFSPLFAGSAGISIWLVASGVRTARRATGARTSRAQSDLAVAAGGVR